MADGNSNLQRLKDVRVGDLLHFGVVEESGRELENVLSGAGGFVGRRERCEQIEQAMLQ